MRESLRAQEDPKGDFLAKNMPIVIEDVSYEVFAMVLEFLYTDAVTGVSLRMGLPLLIASERFMIKRLKALCEEILIKHVCVDNVIGLFMDSHRYNAIGLKDISLIFILKHNN